MTAAARTVFMGSGGFAVPVLDALASHPAVRLVGVVTAPPRPVGRRGDLSPSPVGRRADDLGLAVLEPEGLRHPAAVASIAALEPDLLVLADYGRIVPGALLDLPARGALNVHPSLLPRHRGATPIAAAILAGDAETGVTVIRMDEGIDTGPIVAQRRWPLRGDETAPELEAGLARLGASLLTEVLPSWLTGERTARSQPSEGVTATRPLRREDGRLDAARTARELERQVRAYRPWPGSFVETAAGRVVVLGASVDDRPGDGPDASPVGTLVVDRDGRLALVTGEGRLVLDEVQPAGGRPMTGAALLRGRPSLAGSRVREGRVG